MEIFDWTLKYIKYRDAIKKSILEIEEKNGNEVVVKEKSGNEKTYLCFNELEPINISTFSNQRIVCLNTKENVDWLIKKWGEIIKTKVTFIFVNPEKSASWAVNPALHNTITDKSALKTGIYTLYESIPEA